MALGALSGAIGAQVSSALTGGKEGLQASTKFAEVGASGTKLTALGRSVSGLASYAGNVAGNKLLGRSSGFSWAGVASTVVGATLSSALGGRVPFMEGGGAGEGFWANFGGGIINGVTTSTVDRVFGLGKQSWASIVGSAFGDAWGTRVLQGAKGAISSESPIQFESFSSTEDADGYFSLRNILHRSAIRQAERKLGSAFQDWTLEERLEFSIGSFGEDNEQLRRDAIKKLAAGIAVGDYAPNYGIGGYASVPASYSAGTIYVNPEVLRLRQGGGEGMDLLDASLILALEEELGAHYDYMARKIAGIGGDSYLDEGALFAASGLHGILAGSDSSGVARKSFKIGGKSLNLTTDAVSIRYAASRAFTAERIAADFHSPDGQFESFDALGHYFTTALISLAAGNSPERAARHAFFAQVGDMLAPLDATATAVRAIATLDAPDIAVGLSLAVGEYSMNKVFGLQLRDTLASTYLLSKMDAGTLEELIRIQQNLHSILPKGASMEVERNIARAIIAESHDEGSLMGDAVTGLAIHKLGDTYAHEGYGLLIGHGLDMHHPDRLFGRPAIRTAYVKDLAGALLSANGRAADAASVYETTKRYFSYTADAWSGNDWSSDALDDSFRVASAQFLGAQLGGGFVTTAPSASPFFPYQSAETGLLGISPSVRHVVTGSRDVYTSSDFIMQAFERFNTRVEYWREALHR